MLANRSSASSSCYRGQVANLKELDDDDDDDDDGETNWTSSENIGSTTPIVDMSCVPWIHRDHIRKCDWQNMR